ncbi:MAG: cytochrome P450 [Deltaproteobacteria bacterium]|nr:MAG: cytochrome P450 [Deltaproteobacteria bacterium]
MSRRFRADPYAVYRRLRERDPIHRSRAAAGWVLSRHADILEVLRDERFSADDRNFERYPEMRARAIRDGLADPDRQETPVMLRSDPPDHTRLRGLVSKAFTPRAVEKLRPRIEAIAEELLDGLASRGAFDVIEDFAVPLPVTVIAEMLGIPTADRATFKRWSDILVGFLDPIASPGPEILRATADELFEYVSRIAEERRAKPADDLLSALVLAEQEGDRLSEDELHGTVALLLAAGNETTTNLIGNGLLALLRHPGELARLRAAPELVDAAVEELLRYDSPVQFTARIALEDLDFHGRPFRRGQNAILALGAANRDPAVFEEPDRLDVGRTDNAHISFSQGAHFCLGAQLARLEGRIAFAALLARFPNLRLGAGHLRWRRFTFLRGLAALPVRT